MHRFAMARGAPEGSRSFRSCRESTARAWWWSPGRASGAWAWAAAAWVVRRLGADRVVDARGDEAADRLRQAASKGLNAVLALAGGEELERCLDLLRRGGRVVYPNGVEPEPKRRPGVTTSGFDAV